MTSIYFDEKVATVNSTALASVIKFTIPAGSNFYLKELSINPDSTFQGSGSFQLFVNGESYMTSAKSLPQAFTVELYTFNGGKGVWVRPGDTIEIYGACSSGTGILTAILYGEPTLNTN